MSSATTPPGARAVTAPARLPWTGADAADRLIAENPNALLIGFVLDQQITVQKAFAGPLVMLERLGTLDAGEIARMDPETLAAAFRRTPAIHRFPANMAARVQALCAHLAEAYSGDASRIWREAADGRDLVRRLKGLPGFGEMKVRTVTGLLFKQFAVRLEGLEALVPDYPTLADVTTPEELERYQAGKRAWKASMRAQGIDHSVPRRRSAASGQPRGDEAGR